MNKEEKEQKLLSLCRSHDLTYSFSDDHNTYMRGSRERSEITKFINDNGIERNVATRIWNSVVDEKLVPAARSQFYWK